MDGTPVKNKKGNSSLFIQIAIIFLGLVGGYIYYSQIIKPAKTAVTLPDIPRSDTLNKFQDFSSYNFGILNDPTFKSLKILGNIPIQPGVTGRTDLFAPLISE
ncbi:MAG: hypothetical protein ABR875_01985 [Minisyncoccia bacterium]|jgi:hypothetical protein